MSQISQILFVVEGVEEVWVDELTLLSNTLFAHMARVHRAPITRYLESTKPSQVTTLLPSPIIFYVYMIDTQTPPQNLPTYMQVFDLVCSTPASPEGFSDHCNYCTSY